MQADPALFFQDCSIVNRNTTIGTGMVSATLQRGKPSPLRLGLLVVVGRDVVTFSGLKRPSQAKPSMSCYLSDAFQRRSRCGFMRG
jgi:hypothetical protein